MSPFSLEMTASNLLHECQKIGPVNLLIIYLSHNADTFG